MNRGDPRAAWQGANLPLPEELHRGLLEIATGEHLDRDGEARAAALESVHWPLLEPSAALMQRLLEIPTRPKRPAIPRAWPGPGITLAASYLLAVALTLALGDPLAFGGRASSKLRAAAGEHLLEPASRAGASVQSGLSERLGRLGGGWSAAGFLREPLDLPTDRVSAWFRAAVESFSGAFGATGRDAAQPGEADSRRLDSRLLRHELTTKTERTFA